MTNPMIVTRQKGKGDKNLKYLLGKHKLNQ